MSGEKAVKRVGREFKSVSARNLWELENVRKGLCGISDFRTWPEKKDDS